MSSDSHTTVETDSGQPLRIPNELPVVPLRDLVAFPYMMFPLVVSEPSLLELADEALAGSKIIGLFTVEPAPEAEEVQVGNPGADDLESDDGTNPVPAAEIAAPHELSEVGTVAIIHKMLRFPDGGMRLPGPGRGTHTAGQGSSGHAVHPGTDRGDRAFQESLPPGGSHAP